MRSIEYFSTECRRNQSYYNGQSEEREIRLRANESFKKNTYIYKLPKARQNADDQVASGFSFVSDW